MTIPSFFINRETDQRDNNYSGDCRQPIYRNFESRIGKKNEINANDAEAKSKNKFFQGGERLALSEDGQKKKTAGEEHHQRYSRVKNYLIIDKFVHKRWLYNVLMF